MYTILIVDMQLCISFFNNILKDLSCWIYHIYYDLSKGNADMLQVRVRIT